MRTARSMLFNLLAPLADEFVAFNLFRYLTFRTGGAILTGLLVSFLAGPAVIRWLRVRQGHGQPIRVEGPPAEVVRTLGTVPGVQTVKQDGVGPGDLVTCVVESRKGLDVRKELAATVLKQSWGLLELRPVDLTLEEVFVRLVTEEKEGSA